MDPNRVIIFDTTLRDGEQSPGISLNETEKLEIAHQLARLGVDVIEAGFPIASPGDFAAVRAIAREVHGPVIAGLARAHATDIDRASEAVRDADRPRIHTFISTSDIHIEHQLQSTREDVKGQARDHGTVDLAGDRPYRLEVTWRGDRESSLDHVDAEPRQLLRDLQLLGRVERDPRRLLAVSQGRVEDDDPVGVHGDAP